MSTRKQCEPFSRRCFLIKERTFCALAVWTLVALGRGRILLGSVLCAGAGLVRPTGVALYERRASHERYEVTSADGVDREISVTSFPLFAHADELVGTMTIFWRA